MTNPATSAQTQLDGKPMPPAMARDYLVLAPVNMPDGFDLLATSFAAPAIAKAWQLAPQTSLDI